MITRSEAERERDDKEQEKEKLLQPKDDEELAVEHEWHLYLSHLCFRSFDWDITAEMNQKLHQLWLNIQALRHLGALVREEQSWTSLRLHPEVEKSLEHWLGNRILPSERYPRRASELTLVQAVLKRLYHSPAHLLEAIQKDPSFILEVTPSLKSAWEFTYSPVGNAMSSHRFYSLRSMIFSQMGIKATYHDRFTPEEPFVEILHSSAIPCPLSTVLQRLTTLKEAEGRTESKTRLHLWTDYDPIVAIVFIQNTRVGMGMMDLQPIWKGC